MVEYIKEITSELDFCKAKVQVAEKILNDLKSSGQESVEALVNTIKNYEGIEKTLTVDLKTIQEELDMKKELFEQKKEELKEMDNFVKNESGKQKQKIINLNKKICARKEVIKVLNFEVVYLQQKQEMQ